MRNYIYKNNVFKKHCQAAHIYIASLDNILFEATKNAYNSQTFFCGSLNVFLAESEEHRLSLCKFVFAESKSGIETNSIYHVVWSCYYVIYYIIGNIPIKHNRVTLILTHSKHMDQDF